MFGFFKNRKARESALPPSQPAEAADRTLGSFANPEGQPVVGRRIESGFDPSLASDAPGLADGLAALAQLGPMLQKAMTEGNVQIAQGSAQSIDLRGTGLREQILGIMQAHGIDAEKGTAGASVDAADYAAMQQQILNALSNHGVDLGATGDQGSDAHTGQSTHEPGTTGE